MKEKEKMSLEDVIDAYIASITDSDEASLPILIESYPQYSDELKEVAAFYEIYKKVPECLYTADEELTLSTRAASVVQNVLYKAREQDASAEEEFTGLIDEAEKLTMSPEQLAEATELSTPIIFTLDRRQVRYESIPSKAIDNLARALGRVVKTIKAYLQGEMRLQPAHYLSESAPTAARLQEFSTLVEIDPELGEPEHKIRQEEWLRLSIPLSEARPQQGDQA
jgi:hypothetical protein